jgi:hypothetical protein
MKIAENNRINEHLSNIRVLSDYDSKKDERFIVQRTETGKIILFKKVTDAEMSQYHNELIEQLKNNKN